MSAVYFWHKDKLVTFNHRLFSQDFHNVDMHKYRYCHCVDTFENAVSSRYGHWVVEDKLSEWPAVWQYAPFSGFPAEFKAHLLLLGVS